MFKIKDDNLWFCTDCVQIAVNDDATSLDHHYGVRAAEREKEIREGLAELGPHVHMWTDEDGNHEEEEFSRAWCDGCGSNLAGSRTRFVVMEPDERRIRNKMVQDGHVQPFYVAAFGINRCYGGPEEGGWYYDALRHLEVRKAYDWRQGLMHARDLRETYPTCPRGRHSVIGGEDVSIRTFRHLDDLPDETTNRPRYE